jgi:hypothetical protein
MKAWNRSIAAAALLGRAGFVARIMWVKVSEFFTEGGRPGTGQPAHIAAVAS